MPYLNLPDASLHYQQWGEGPCVAFLHGNGGNHLSWWQQVPTLTRDFRCLLLDLRGYGFSRAETSPQDPAVFGDDLIALLDHLNVVRCHILGQSIGGHYALRFALAHQQRVHGLVLADTLAGSPTMRSRPRLPPRHLFQRTCWNAHSVLSSAANSLD